MQEKGDPTTENVDSTKKTGDLTKKHCDLITKMVLYRTATADELAILCNTEVYIGDMN